MIHVVCLCSFIVNLDDIYNVPVVITAASKLNIEAFILAERLSANHNINNTENALISY